jgi:hypothetical protein
MHFFTSRNHRKRNVLQAPGASQQRAAFDHAAARQEGWVLSECDPREDGSGHVEIQRVDNPENGTPVFEDDHAAWKHVVQRARAGSTLHRQALDLADKVERALIEIAHGAW